MQPLQDPNKLEVYTEATKRKKLVGMLSFNPESNIFHFKYDKGYLKSRSAIPLGPELSLKRQVYTSPKKLFPSMEDRIPSRSNPAYKDYCLSQGISPSEKNPIVLLTTIGRRGPSSFVFEPVYSDTTANIPERLKCFRNELGISQEDFANAFDLNLVTINRVEKGKSTDRNVMKLIELYLKYPEVSAAQLSVSRKKIHQNTFARLMDFFGGSETRRKT